ncbi:MAG: aminopeptidase [Deltaproteobacteria bacterium]|jgi:aspartyl aminopeptidase|nr:aminopeptidase [Deltaproteobacteria bacterium]
MSRYTTAPCGREDKDNKRGKAAAASDKAAGKGKGKGKDAAPETLNIWDRSKPEEREEIELYARDYMDFLTEAKTERKAYSLVLGHLEKEGFTDLANGGKIGRGGYLGHFGKLLGAYAPGRLSPAGGFNLIVAHGDSPRLDLKPRCVYEEGSLALLKSNMYGGLKKFQWLARPVALWGFAALKDGRAVDFRFGEDPAGPVLTITDILPHLDRKVQRDKRLVDAFPAEKLNVLAASVPCGERESKHRLKQAVFKILEDRWGLKEEDLISSEIEIVPAGPAVPVGLDGSFIGGYGQDDRLSVYAMLRAFLAVEKPERPLILLLVDREEIGSRGATAAATRFVERLAALALESAGVEPGYRAVLDSLARSHAVSADVEAGVDPTFKEVSDEMNSAKVTFGPAVVRYTGGAAKYGASEAGAEYMAKIRAVYDGDGVIWQSSLLGKQEEGGGGTVAMNFADFGMGVVDSGAPVLSMHSPFEISSKADVWMTYRAYRAFYRDA